MKNNQHLLPIQVKLASSLLLVYWTFGLTRVLLGHHPPASYVTAAVFTGFFGLLLLCIWLISRGTNWARWLFLVWFVWNCLFSPWRLNHFSPTSAMDAIFPSVQLLLQAVALVLLFLPTTSNRFRGRVRPAQQGAFSGPRDDLSVLHLALVAQGR